MGLGLLFPDFEWMVGRICILNVCGYCSVLFRYGLDIYSGNKGFGS